MVTKGEKKSISEIEKVINLLGLNYKDIESYEKRARLPVLQSIIDHYARGEVISNYTFIDEMLNVLICHNFFDRERSFIKYWKTKKFQAFNYFILEKLSLLNKLDLVKFLIKIPDDIESDIKSINSLRNGLAHSFFPQNLKRNRSIYKGKKIFTLEGLKQFTNDSRKINRFLTKKAFKLNEADFYITDGT